MKMLANSAENLLELVEKFKIINIRRIIPINNGILSKMREKFWLFFPKMKKI